MNDIWVWGDVAHSGKKRGVLVLLSLLNAFMIWNMDKKLIAQGLVKHVDILIPWTFELVVALAIVWGTVLVYARKMGG